MLHEVLQEKRDLILEIAKEHGIQNIRIFGSVAGLEEGLTSDIALIVDVNEGRSLFDLIRFKHDLEDLLNIKVEVVTENAIHLSIKEDVLKRAIQL